MSGVSASRRLWCFFNKSARWIPHTFPRLGHRQAHRVRPEPAPHGCSAFNPDLVRTDCSAEVALSFRRTVLPTTREPAELASIAKASLNESNCQGDAFWARHQARDPAQATTVPRAGRRPLGAALVTSLEGGRQHIERVPDLNAANAALPTRGRATARERAVGLCAACCGRAQLSEGEA